MHLWAFPPVEMKKHAPDVFIRGVLPYCLFRPGLHTSMITGRIMGLRLVFLYR